jgi:site-specific DNA-methyltransferase (adenine-specific)
MPKIELIQGDCLEKMKDIPDKSIDLILADLPYGTTACKWDTIIPFEPLWEQYKRIIKDNGAIVLTASQPFTSALVMSNPSMFRQSLAWLKNKPMNFMNANKMFMKWHEDIIIFYKNLPTYNPQKTKGKLHKNGNTQNTGNITQYTVGTQRIITESEYYHPKSILEFAIEHKTPHPTEKPVALFEYLIKTYTNEGDIVLDNCMGSGTTGVACKNLNRNFIGIEKDPEYFKIAEKRINENL